MNKYRQFIMEAKTFSKPDILYHGTSSEFLRSILKHGLSTLQAKEGRWVNEDDNIAANQRSRKSYGGIYFTPNLMTARSSASNLLIKKHGLVQNIPEGVNSLIVVVQIQSRATLPDEDNYQIRISDFTNEQMFPYILLRTRLKKMDKQTTEILNAGVDKLLKRYGGDTSKRTDLHILKSLAKEVYLTEIERQFAHNSIRVDPKKGSWSSEAKIKKAYETITYPNSQYIVPKELRPRSTVQAEADARKALDLFIRKTKDSVVKKLEEPHERSWTNVRTEEPITFRGRNRIIAVVELIDGKNYKDPATFKVHYGKIPEDFFTQYENRVGGTYVLASEEWPARILLYRGETSGNRGGGYFTEDKDFALQFTQSGQEKELMRRYINTKDIYKAIPLTSAVKEDDWDRDIAIAKSKGFKAILIDEGYNEPNSIYVFDKSALSRSK
jgi:hypothetical protein